MAKILHVADVHLDSPLRGLERYEGAPVEECRLATRKAFTRLADEAIDEAIDAMLISGDLYDGDWPDFHTGLFFAHQMARLDQKGIRVFLIRGNHDAQSRITKQLPLPKNVHEFPCSRAETVVIDELQLALHGQGFAKAAVTTNLAKDYPAAKEGCCNIGLLHTSLDGREGHAPYAPCQLADLTSKGYQYWALGHVHAREVVCEDPWIVYPGNLQGRHIRETGEKGYYLVESDGEEIVSVDFREISIVRWDEVAVDLTSASELDSLHDELRDALQDYVEDAAQTETLCACRVILRGKTPLHPALLRQKERWEQDLRALAMEFVEPKIWIEKLSIQTAIPDQLEASEGAVGELLELLKELGDRSAEDELWKELEEECRGLRRLGEAALAEEEWNPRDRLLELKDSLLAQIQGGAE